MKDKDLIDKLIFIKEKAYFSGSDITEKRLQEVIDKIKDGNGEKFQVGDKVVYHSDAIGNINGEIIAYEPRVKGYPYIICIEARDGYGVTTANEKKISYKKDKTELEKGDKFLTIHETEGECTVLCRGTNFFGKVEYYYKDKKGGTDIVSVDYIKEVLI